MDSALHLEDLELRFGGAANKKGLFDHNEPMLLVERPRVGSGNNNNNLPFMPHLSVLDCQGEQMAAKARPGGLWPDKEEGDLTRAEAKEAKNTGTLLSEEELTGFDRWIVNFVCSPFEPGVELGGRVRRPAEIEH